MNQSTALPAGQRCTQRLRAWLTAEIGPAFRFDGHMRDFFTRTDGSRTLADAVQHWHQTRGGPDGEIAEQFELNRFTRQWSAAHPHGSRSALLTAWRTYRDQPVDRRGRT